MLIACSHLVIATDDVERLTRFFATIFEAKPHFENLMFSEFVLGTGFRIAFFKPVGTASRFFSTASARASAAFGVTVVSVDETYGRVLEFQKNPAGWGLLSTSGAPKEHPWGEKSFLLIDPDGNRWEVAQSPSANGMLINREETNTSE
jgi:catechol 2,3-dioxygenase-like lactoylglutathione lyase family enzyme